MKTTHLKRASSPTGLGRIFHRTRQLIGATAALIASLAPSSLHSQEIYGLGVNAHGQLGDGTTTTRYAPTPTIMTGALFGKTVTAISAGDGHGQDAHTVALSSDGLVYAWGHNGFGQLGDGSTTTRTAPIAVDMTGALSGKTVTALATGQNFTLALTSEGKVYSWGVNSHGQLGNGNTTTQLTPVAVDMTGVLAGKTVVAIAAGSGAYSDQGHCLALTSEGKVYSWGSNQNGKLGDGTSTARTTPVAVNTAGALSGKTVTAISAGGGHSVALTTEGFAYAWGGGSLGDGTSSSSLTPVAVDRSGVLSGKTLTAISAGYYNGLAIALSSEGKVYAWGSANGLNYYGDGTSTSSNSPVAVNMTGVLNGKTVSAISGHGIHCVALTTDGKVYGWGYNVGNLGSGGGSTVASPIAIGDPGVLATKTVTAITTSVHQTLLIASTVPGPEIAVEQPLNSDIADGGSRSFGSLYVGDNASLTFTVKNSGNLDLTGLGITIDGANAADFSVTTSPTAPVAVAGSTTFTVQFSPLSTGAKTAVLHIANNDANESPFDITLTGTALPNAPEIAVEQPLNSDIADGGSRSFGGVAVGSNASRTFTVKNTGNLSLTGLGITIDGANAADFSVTTSPTAPVAAAGSTTFTVQFSPSSGGARTAALHIANNDTDEAPFDITLTGIGSTGAGKNVLLIWDSLDAQTAALKTALENAGHVVTYSAVSEFNYNGTNPAPAGFDAVIHLNGIAWYSAMPAAGQIALTSFTQAGGVYVGGQWNSYEIGSTANLSELVLFSYAGEGTANRTYTAVPAQAGHPLLAGIPSPFTFNTGYVTCAQRTFEANPSTILMTADGGSPAVAVRNVGSGIAVDFAHAPSYSNTTALSNANVQQLYINAVSLAGGGEGPANTAPTDIALSANSIAENNAANAQIGTLSATDANGGDTHTFTLVSGAGSTDNGAFTIAGNSLRITASADFETQSSYAIRIRATDSGSGNLTYEEAFTVNITDVTIPQVINFAALGGKTFGDAPFAVSATGGASGQPVTFSVVSGPASIAVDTVSITGAGSVTIRASQAGFGDYSAASNVDQSFTVAKAAQSITFGALSGKTFGDAPFAVSATGGASEVPVTFSIVSGPATIAVDTVTITGAGNVTVRASQSGNANYEAAANVEQTFAVAKAAQSIAFTAPAIAGSNDTVTLSATGGASGNEVTFSVFSGPGSLAGNVLTFSATGTVVVRASQAGNANYEAAPDVDQTITVDENVSPVAVDDAVTTTIGATTLYPLANDTDANGDLLSIASVSDGAITISGRSLIIPGGHTASFTYTVTDGRGTDIGAVTVTAETPITGPTRWSGLLHDGNGDITGAMSVSGSATGRNSASIRLGSELKGLIFKLDASGQATQVISLGTLNVSKDTVTEQLTVSLESGANTYTGTLRAAQSSATPRQYNIALASVDAAIPGGGYARAIVRATGAVSVTGKLPDGRNFTNRTRLLDNGGMVIYTTAARSQSTGIIAGELVAANLTSTDVTGELAWAMGTQPLGLHTSGVDTTLTANGCLFAPGDTLPAGAVELVASGGNLVAPLTVATTANAGVPTVSTVFPSWRISLSRGVQTGQFMAKVRTPTNLRSVSGSGVYLPKSNRAYGWFPGTTEGGKIEMTVP